jgi:O2-independent ubiquinone biosynthesis protein UbiV
MVGVARIFRAVVDGREDAEGGTDRLAQLYPRVPFSNGFLHGVAGFSSRASNNLPGRTQCFRHPIEPRTP